jgi:hypothetical protein
MEFLSLIKELSAPLEERCLLKNTSLMRQAQKPQKESGLFFANCDLKLFYFYIG